MLSCIVKSTNEMERHERCVAITGRNLLEQYHEWLLEHYREDKPVAIIFLKAYLKHTIKCYP